VRKSNYDKQPFTNVEGSLWSGWSDILTRLSSHFPAENDRFTVVVECYQGIHEQELKEAFLSLKPALFIESKDWLLPEGEIRKMTDHWMTDDRLFGKRTPYSLKDFFDTIKVEALRQKLSFSKGLTIIFGYGASLISERQDLLIYADMPRWEIQLRSRRHEIHAIGVDNSQEEATKQYKRGYFLDWLLCDEVKKPLLEKADYWLDTVIPEQPKMISGATLRAGLEKTAKRPFRVVPFFDPAPWGGQWMKEVCGLDPKESNYGWCFDCVPEENSLYLQVQGQLFEMPANNLVFHQSRQLLGAPVEARFGLDFPIRFDFLDTMGGGNLSLQVHPITQYIRDHFGIPYTQDESYYLLDADPEKATVYLGVKKGIDRKEMLRALWEAQREGKPFDAERYINRWPARKHDHFLIPAGTIHCSGEGAMVLEISATPSIFTFKLWDWGRLGLDGRPRPINIEHGSHVIQWERDTDYVRQHLVHQVTLIAEGDGWKEERTGLHENEFIETRRHWFTKKVPHNTGNSVNVLNVVEGEEVIVESPKGCFESFVAHYAETFIIPAGIGDYTIRPYGLSEGKRCGTIKAYVRFKS
jgi:mannose-6-phosphate isomerase class I